MFYFNSVTTWPRQLQLTVKFFDEKIYEAINHICYKRKGNDNYLIIHSRCICQYDFGGPKRKNKDSGDGRQNSKQNLTT